MKQNYVFILLIFISKFLFNNSEITEKEIETICEIGKYNSYKRIKDYSTLQEYYKHKFKDKSSNDQFIMSFLMNGNLTKNLDKYIKKIIVTIITLGLAFLTLISYLILIILWRNNKCLFINLNKSERKKRQIYCKYCGYLTSIILIIVSIILCSVVLLLNNQLKKNINASLCSLYHFTKHAINGLSENEVVKDEYPIFPGFSKIDEILISTSTSTNVNVFLNSNTFPKYNDLINKDENIINVIQDYSTNYGTTNIIPSPNPNILNTVRLLLNYQKLYGPYTSQYTILGEFYENYTNTIHLAIDSLKKLKSDFNDLMSYQNNINDAITNIDEELGGFQNLYLIVENIIIKNYHKLKNKFTKIIVILIYIYLTLVLFEGLLLILFSTCFICDKNPTSCMYNVRIIYFVVWNFMFISIIGVFSLSSFFSFYFSVNNEITPVSHYILSEKYMSNTDDSSNIFLSLIQKNAAFSSYFQVCLNGKDSSNSNIAYSFGIHQTFLRYINSLYQDYRDFKKYYSTINETIESVQILLSKNSLFEKYKNNMTLTTNYNEHKENDVTYNMDKFNVYTDSSLSNSLQIKCVSATKDRWVTNIGDCPNNYIYLSPEEFYFEGGYHCLILNEWDYDKENIRYFSACKNFNGETIEHFTNSYFLALKDFYNNNANLINNIIEANNHIYELIEDIKEDLTNEYNADSEFFENYLSDYITYNGLVESSTIYDMFDCSLLRYDLIDFYDISNHHFKNNVLIQLSFTVISGILLYISQYFGVRLMYVFNKDFKFEEENDSNEEEEDEIDDEDKNIYKKRSDKLPELTNSEKLDINSDNYLTREKNETKKNKVNPKSKRLSLMNNPMHINYFKDNNTQDKSSENNSENSSSQENPIYTIKNPNINSNDNDSNGADNLKNSSNLINNGNIRGLYKNNTLKNPLGLNIKNNKNNNSESNSNNNNSEEEEKKSEVESEEEEKKSEGGSEEEENVSNGKKEENDEGN